MFFFSSYVYSIKLFYGFSLINYNIPGGTMFICVLYLKMLQYHHLIPSLYSSTATVLINILALIVKR